MLLSAALGNAPALAACANSTAPHPQAMVALQLIFADDARAWEWVDELGVKYVRIELRWDWLEPLEGQYDWSYIDRVVAFARARDTRILLLFNHAPRWAAKDVAALPARVGRAVGALAQRHRFSAFEIFNEPNLAAQGWVTVDAGPQASARLYAQTLAAASSAIRSVDRDAIVVSAGLSPQGDDPEAFLREVVRATPPQCYDAVGVHPYGLQGRFQSVQANVATLLAQEGLPTKPAWFTEYGTSSNSARESVIRQLFAERGASPITFVYSERDVGGWFAEPYGLRKHDGSPKPEYDIFKGLMRAASPRCVGAQNACKNH